MNKYDHCLLMNVHVVFSLTDNYFAPLPRVVKSENKCVWKHFEVRESPGRGLGVFCIKEIKHGGVDLSCFFALHWK